MLTVMSLQSVAIKHPWPDDTYEDSVNLIIQDETMDLFTVFPHLSYLALFLENFSKRSDGGLRLSPAFSGILDFSSARQRKSFGKDKWSCWRAV